ncbi:MAG: phage tail protein [Pirellulaceae bacterium]|jgi:hypothetical protein|nr:phage tail protein [Pirellulaceae bacterium]MDP7018319.1 phage tail protein [Pirellulaceae bacterium]
MFIFRFTLIVAVALTTSTLVAARDAFAQEAGVVQIARYRVSIKGIDPFVVDSISGIGYDVEGAAKGQPLPFRSKIREIKMTRQFNENTSLHRWLQLTKSGQIDPKDGEISLETKGGKSLVRFKLRAAWCTSWVIRVPDLSERGLVRETITLKVQDFALDY